jgi:formylglycine-generating enzyme required for sulfatase activity
MGCGDWDKNCRVNEKPAHKVCLKPFLISRYEVTQQQWRKIMGANPASFAKGSDYPVESVSWRRVQQFIAKLNSMSSGKHVFRLPAEAEWEYACRSLGTQQVYAGGGDVAEAAWYRRNSKQHPHPVGAKKPNGLGLSDMSGNVAEWVQDDYDSEFYANSSERNPVCEAGEAGLKVLRGGSWNSPAVDARCTARSFYYADQGGNMAGFRLVMELTR